MIGIYKFTNKCNRKVYIGQSVNIEKRYKEHISACFNRNEKSLFYNSLRLYTIDGFDFEVLHECPKEQLNYWETFYISYYCAYNRRYGYNRTTGGQKNFNHSVSKETRRKISIAKTGTHHTEETRLKMSEAQKGKPNYKNRGKPSPNKGKHWSPEYIVIFSEAHKGQIPWNKGIPIREETRIKLREYNLKNPSRGRLGKESPIKGKHKVWDDKENNIYHFE